MNNGKVTILNNNRYPILDGIEFPITVEARIFDRVVFVDSSELVNKGSKCDADILNLGKVAFVISKSNLIVEY